MPTGQHLRLISLLGAVSVVATWAAALDVKDDKKPDDIPWTVRTRAANDKIDRVVLHCSAALIDLATEQPLAKEEWFKKDRIYASWRKYGFHPHYFIARDGVIYKLADEENLCYHAGRYNGRGIGVELAGIGGEKWMQKLATDKQATADELDYTAAQYASLGGLLNDIHSRRADAKAIFHSDLHEDSVLAGADGAVVRKEAKADGEKLKQATKDTVLWVRKQSDSGDWLEVEYEFAKFGWVSKDHVKDRSARQRKFDPGDRFKTASVTTTMPWTTDH